jgi:hypothetical protein
MKLPDNEQVFLEAVKQWMSEPGTTTYLASEDSMFSGPDSKPFSKRYRMSKQLRCALLKAGAKNSGKQMAFGKLRGKLTSGHFAVGANDKQYSLHSNTNR